MRRLPAPVSIARLSVVVALLVALAALAGPAAALALPGDEGDADLGILLAPGGIALAVGRWRGRAPSAAVPSPAPGPDRIRPDADMERYEP